MARLWRDYGAIMARSGSRICGANSSKPLRYPYQRRSWLSRQCSQTRFRIRPPKQQQENDSAFVRHVLFPRVVKGLYDQTCAVCRIRARTPKGSLVEAAHILPFAKFHNDDPRNGLALCPNHHDGFDLGWFSIADDFTILVSCD